MSAENIQNRAAGAIMGAFIGDALGLGPHWYYSLADLRRDYGDWIDGRRPRKSGRSRQVGRGFGVKDRETLRYAG